MANATTPDHRIFSIPIAELHPTLRARSGSRPFRQGRHSKSLRERTIQHIVAVRHPRKTRAITFAAWYIVDGNHRAGRLRLNAHAPR
jgi:hypothetical protein